MKKQKSIPGAVIGIIASVFVLIGALYLIACAEVVDTVSNAGSAITGGAVEETNYTWAAYVFGFGAFGCALVGAILDFSKPIVGGILLAVSLVFMIVDCCVIYWAVLVIIAIVLVGVAALLSFLVRKDAVEAPAANNGQQQININITSDAGSASATTTTTTEEKKD